MSGSYQGLELLLKASRRLWQAKRPFRWRPLLEEMVSLIACTQNEIAKGIMDAWATILQAQHSRGLH